MILGAEVYSYVIEEGLRKGSLGTPTAPQTSLGWILSGFLSEEFSSSRHSLVGLQTTVDYELPNSLRRFVIQEDVPSTISEYSLAEEDFEQLFSSTHQLSHDGRYIVRLPLKDRSLNLGDSRAEAYRALIQRKRRFRRDPDLYKKYSDVIKDYSEFEKSSSTKLQVVFNASQHTDKGLSLNDLLHSVSKLQTELSDVILGWRMYPVIFTTDIEKMSLATEILNREVYVADNVDIAQE
ncbi:uncharacterized protein LOC117175548 [Belonocnema kinseyi]|uniref:uncharacterized protein LOC117175548 n=1 Tax=Belonocnema kinseyi TaxID=2817044 RepID=UPI00143CF6E4|nr:uncharacterized protein LOC117175548 [Belonocnema kinseyi]